MPNLAGTNAKITGVIAIDGYKAIEAGSFAENLKNELFYFTAISSVPISILDY